MNSLLIDEPTLGEKIGKLPGDIDPAARGAGYG